MPSRTSPVTRREDGSFSPDGQEEANYPPYEREEPNGADEVDIDAPPEIGASDQICRGCGHRAAECTCRYPFGDDAAIGRNPEPPSPESLELDHLASVLELAARSLRAYIRRLDTAANGEPAPPRESPDGPIQSALPRRKKGVKP